jgi:hypothetical protein
VSNYVKKCQVIFDSVKKIDTADAKILNETRLDAESGGFYLLGTKIAIHLAMK